MNDDFLLEEPLYQNEDWQQQLDLEHRRQEPAEIRRLVRMAYEGQPEEAGRQAKSLGLYEQMLQHMLRASRFFTFKDKHERNG